jgi:Protein of unknown function (DUF4236)
MGLRFGKRLRLFKGAWINLSNQGGYLSIGGHGVTTNVSKECRRRKGQVSYFANQLTARVQTYSLTGQPTQLTCP